MHFSWILIFLLITFSLANQLYPADYPHWSEQKLYTVSIISALLFFASVVLHELAHSVVARAFRMSVHSITLFLLGGVASLTREPPSARAEFFMATAGPATSFLIGGIGLGIAQVASNATDELPWLQPVVAVAGYVGGVNILVALFNLIPGFPLDGGRVLRSILWGLRNDRANATKIAARGGQVVAGLFALYAAARVLYFNDSGGLWMGLIAYFLYGAATQTLQQERVVHALGGARVAQLMTGEFVAVPRGTSIATLIRDYVLPHNLRAIPIVDGGSFAGLVTIGDLRKVEQDLWPSTTVDAVMTPASDLPSVGQTSPLTAALERFGEDVPLLPVLQDGVLVGLLYRESVIGYVRMREMLGFDSRR